LTAPLFEQQIAKNMQNLVDQLTYTIMKFAIS